VGRSAAGCWLSRADPAKDCAPFGGRQKVIGTGGLAQFVGLWIDLFPKGLSPRSNFMNGRLTSTENRTENLQRETMRLLLKELYLTDSECGRPELRGSKESSKFALRDLRKVVTCFSKLEPLAKVGVEIGHWRPTDFCLFARDRSLIGRSLGSVCTAAKGWTPSVAALERAAPAP
jgi:hypothetical protein